MRYYRVKEATKHVIFFSLSKLILKSQAVMISLLQLSDRDKIGVNLSINAFKSSFRVLGDRYIFPIVNVLYKVLPCTLTINPSHCSKVLRLNVTFDLYWSSTYITSPPLLLHV